MNGAKPSDRGEVGASVPGARRVVIPDAAHMVTLERPAEFHTILREFLSSPV